MATMEQKQYFHEAHGSKHGTFSTVQCIDGTGTIEYYQVFPGVELFFNQFQAYHCEECYEAGDPLQINFCSEGRFECSFSQKESCILGPGDFSVHKYEGSERGAAVSQFPLGFYRGPVYQYLREYRMEKAAVALSRTDTSVTEIALEAGFTNPGKFAEGFKRRYGMTPTQYRIKNRSNSK